MLKRAQEQKIKNTADKLDLEKKLAELPESIREMNYLEV